jgi:glycine cleavage system transcriptional repressor
VRTFALLAVGGDRPGIIAAVAERLVAHGVNVTDSQMGILRGHFAMALLITVPDGTDLDALRADVDAAGEQLRLESLTLRPVDEARAALDTPTHVVNVYGADHPGILAAVTRALAAAGVNVCDLRTRLVGEDSVYVMVINVALPASVDAGAVQAALEAVAEREGVDVALQAAEADLL